MTHAANVWNKFCQRFNVVEQSVPLFTTYADGVVKHRMLGRSSRPILMRSPEMEALILVETDKLVEDWQSGLHRYDGLIYCMGERQGDQFIPLYIGKAWRSAAVGRF